MTLLPCLTRTVRLVVLSVCVGTWSCAQDEAAGVRAHPGLEEARARVQALVLGPANRLGAFRPVLTLANDPRAGVQRNVPLVDASAPWPDTHLALQVPEHSWTRLAEEPLARRLLFPGDDPRMLKPEWKTQPFAAREPAAWVEHEDGSLALDCALAEDVRVHFRILPGERMLELRFGVTNGSARTLGETWAQFCTILGACAPLAEQAPETAWLRLDGALADWGGTGQDLAWLARLRAPDTQRLERAAFFLALVTGCRDERYPPERFQQGDSMWLQRTVDLPLLVKSAPDLTQHLFLYSPHGRALMYNAYRPCAHVDPHLDGVAPGETRWGVVYLLFFEGEREELVSGLAELDRELRSGQGFLGE